MAPNTDIRPLLVNASDTGGSATATKRIHRALRTIGVNSRMLVQEKSTNEGRITGPSSKLERAWSLARPHIDMLPLRLYGRTSGFTVNWLPEGMNNRIEEIDPDLVHLNWMGRGAMSIRSIGKIDRPIVWRFPDMHAMTGGCHYAAGCEGFEDKCGSCPQLDSVHDVDLSRFNWHRKNHHWEDLDLTIVTPSTWLAEQAEKSSLFRDYRIEVIPNPLNTDIYKPRDRSLGREFFGLPEDKHLILFGAIDPMGDPRKGADLLQEALQQLSGDIEDTELVIFGSEEPENQPNFEFPTNYVGYLHDDPSLAMLYSAADVMVVPSRYEGFGQTMSESMACGTPVVAFDATGPADIVINEKTGYLAKPYDVHSLADGIDWVLNKNSSHNLREQAREAAVQRYAQGRIAHEYCSLYKSLI